MGMARLGWGGGQWGGGGGDSLGRVDRKEGAGRGRWLGGQWGGENCEGAMGRGAMRRGRWGGGATGRGRWGGGKAVGSRRDKRREDFTDRYRIPG